MADIDKHQLKPLFQKALSGDGHAWNEFFRKIREYLHAEVRKVLWPVAGAPPEYSVVVQSTLRRAWEHFGSLVFDGPKEDGLDQFIGWITTILRNRSKCEFIRIIKNPAVPIGPVIEDIPECQPPGRAAQRYLLSVELARALAQLPAHKRQAIELFWFEGLSDAEISERLGRSAAAVKALRFRALRSLQTPQLLSLLEDHHDRRC